MGDILLVGVGCIGRGMICFFFFFFQAEDGIRDTSVTGVQTCALPICPFVVDPATRQAQRAVLEGFGLEPLLQALDSGLIKIGRASCRERV